MVISCWTLNSYAVHTRKARLAYPLIAAITLVPVEEVKLINDHYWKEIRSKLTDMTSPRVTLIGMGDMNIKHWKMDERIAYLQTRVEKSSKWNTPEKDSPYYTAYVKDMYKLRKMEALLQTDSIKKGINKQKRLDYEA